jgi:hypothetical protein
MKTSLGVLSVVAVIGMLACAQAHAKLVLAQGGIGPPATASAIGDPVAADAVKAATQATERWLADLDSGNFGDSWKGAANVFKLGVTESEWVAEFESMHARLGKTTTRELTGAQFSATIRGAPTTGEYVTVSYLTKYANAPIAVETLIVSKETDGEWRIAGYKIGAAPDK